MDLPSPLADDLSSSILPYLGKTLSNSESENSTECGSTETDILDEHIRLEVPGEVPVHEGQIDPFGRPEGDAPSGLPGKVRFAGPDIEVVGNIPPVT